MRSFLTSVFRGLAAIVLMCIIVPFAVAVFPFAIVLAAIEGFAEGARRYNRRRLAWKTFGASVRIAPALLLVPLLLLLTGCASSFFRTEIAPKVASGINRYCQEPLALRQPIRDEVNRLITPHAIKVTCDGDPQ
jgi:hypothetical protein